MRTSRHTSESTFSKQTVGSERYEAVVTLGEKVVRELGRAESADTLSQWMAHYLAEKIEGAKNCSGTEQQTKMRECCDLILELWKRRRDFPNGTRPFEGFEPVLRVLERLDPSNPHLWVLTDSLDQTVKRPRGRSPDWLGTASAVDSAASGIILYCVAEATRTAAERSREWLKTAEAAGVADGHDFETARKLIEIHVSFVGAKDPQTTRRRKLLEELNTFLKHARQLRRRLSAAK